MAASEAPARQRPWLVIGLVVALVIAGLAYVSETARSTQLEGQVASLEGELQSANESLQAYEQRMDVVRAQVAEVSAQMALLEQAVAEAPE
jgi:chromosome segregation ATPase